MVVHRVMEIASVGSQNMGSFAIKFVRLTAKIRHVTKKLVAAYMVVKITSTGNNVKTIVLSNASKTAPATHQQEYVWRAAERAGLASFVILHVVKIVLIPAAISILGIVAKDVTIQTNTLDLFATQHVPNFVEMQNVIDIHSSV